MECILNDTGLHLVIDPSPTVSKDHRMCLVYEAKVEKGKLLPSQVEPVGEVPVGEVVFRETGDTPELALYSLHKHFADRCRKT